MTRSADPQATANSSARGSSRLRGATIGLIALTIVSLTLMCLFAWYPLLPSEGDPFGCWIPFAKALREDGLRHGFQAAGGPGRYPGYAIVLDSLMRFSGGASLESLRLARLAALALSLSGAYALLVALGLSKPHAIALTLALHLSPFFLAAVASNTQDAFKSGAFLWAALFLILATRRTIRARTRVLLGAAFGLCATFLALLRAPDLIPLAAFAMGYLWHVRSTPASNDADSTVAGKPRTFALAAWLILPVLVTAWVHVEGYRAVGHWQLSGKPRTPETWLAVYRARFAASAATPGKSWLRRIVEFPIETLAYKSVWFAEDAILQQPSHLHILYLPFNPGEEVKQGFSPTPHLDWGSPRNILLLIGGVALATLAVGMVLRDLRMRRPQTPFFLAACAAALFWTFGYDHYEPRYWALVFLCLFLGIAIRLRHVAVWSRIALPILIACFLILMAREASWARSADRFRQPILESWRQYARESCADEHVLLAVPRSCFSWSAFRWVVWDECPAARLAMYADDPVRGRLLSVRPRPDDRVIFLPESAFQIVR